MKRPPWPVLLLVIFVAAGLGVLAGYRSLRPAAVAPNPPALSSRANSPTAPATVDEGAGSLTDPAAAELAGAPPAPPVPDEVPALTLPDMAGKPHALRANGGRPRIYNFWATWCEPCRREIPLLNGLEARYRADRLEVVGVAIDFHDTVQEFLARTPLGYTLLVGEEEGLEAARSFGMSLALPFSVFADGQNRVVAVKLGEVHGDEIEAILGRMREVRTGHQSLAQARAAIADDLKALSVKRALQSKTG